MSGKKYSKVSFSEELENLEIVENRKMYSPSIRDDVEGVIETLPTKDSRGFIRLEKHMGSGEGNLTPSDRAGQKCWSKIEILLKKRNSGQKRNFWSKKKQNFGQKTKF